MRYWVYQDSDITGPFEREELPTVPGLSADSLVCPEEAGVREGDWRSLGSVPELASLSLAASGVALACAPEQEASRGDFAAAEYGAFTLEGLISGEPISGAWDRPAVGPAESGFNALLEAEKLHNSQLEASLTELRAQLENYERRQDEILERLNAKDQLLEEREKKLEEIYQRIADLKKKLVQPVSAPEQTISEPEPQKPEPQKIGSPSIGESAQAGIADQPQPEAQPRQGLMDDLLAAKDKEIAELQARVEQLEDAIILAPQAPVTAAPEGQPEPLRPEPAPMNIPKAAPLKSTAALTPIEFVPPLPPESAVSLPADEISPLPSADQPRPNIPEPFASSPISLELPPEALSPAAPAERPNTMLAGESPFTEAAAPGPANLSQEQPAGLEPLSYTPIPLSDDPQPWPAPSAASPVQLPQTILQNLGMGASGAPASFTPSAPAPFQDLMGNVSAAPSQASEAPAGVAAASSVQPRRKQRGFLVALVLAMLCLAAVVAFFLKDPRQVVQMVSMDPTHKAGEEPTRREAPPASPAFPDNPYAQRSAETVSANKKEEPKDFIEDRRMRAIELVKNYSLGQARGTIAQWLQYSFLSPGNEERWDAGAVEANVYVVTYRVFKSGRTDRASQVVNYNFEVDLARNTVIGSNPEAKELLGGVEPASRQAAPSPSVRPKPRRATRPQRKKAKKKARKAPVRVQRGPLPQLPLPEEDASSTTLEFNP